MGGVGGCYGFEWVVLGVVMGLSGWCWGGCYGFEWVVLGVVMGLSGWCWGLLWV